MIADPQPAARKRGDELIEAQHAPAVAGSLATMRRLTWCVRCHNGTLFTDANSTLHPPADSMAEPESPSYA